MKTVFRALNGSSLYGLTTKDSDTDYFEVYMPSLESLVTRSSTGVRDGAVKSELVLGEKVDVVKNSVHHFFEVCMTDHSAVEKLFVPYHNTVVFTKEWGEVVNSRDVFLTKDVSKVVDNLQLLTNKRSNETQLVRNALELDDGEFADYLKGKLVTDSDNVDYYELLGKRYGVKSFTNNEVRSILKKRVMRAKPNPLSDKKRDKVATEMLRRALSKLELLETGVITFPVPERERLLSVKTGRMSKDEVMDWADSLVEELKSASARSSLKQSVNVSEVNSLILKLYDMSKWLVL